MGNTLEPLGVELGKLEYETTKIHHPPCPPSLCSSLHLSPLSHPSHPVPPEAPEAGENQGLPADGGGVHQEPGADEAP